MIESNSNKGKCANHSQILGDKAETNREMEGKDKAVVTFDDVYLN